MWLSVSKVIENLKGFDQPEVKILVTIANDLKELTITTNKLVELTKEISNNPDKREFDMLLSIGVLGRNCIYFCTLQCYTHGRIVRLFREEELTWRNSIFCPNTAKQSALP